MYRRGRRKRSGKKRKTRLAPGFRTLLQMPFELAFRKFSAWRKSAVQAAKHPNQKNDRQWDADEPKQQTASHNFLLQGLQHRGNNG
jgi:hypothetical protein